MAIGIDSWKWAHTSQTSRIEPSGWQHISKYQIVVILTIFVLVILNFNTIHQSVIWTQWTVLHLRTQCT